MSGKHKLVMIGWDGATWDLLAPWAQAGELPHFKRLMRSGTRAVLQSTPLPLSPSAWSTIVTGQSPGVHGVFDWFERKPGSYEVDYVNTHRIGARRLWDYFTEAGQQIGIFCLPMLYPAVPLNGFMISGMAAPSAQAPDFAYPPELLKEMEAQIGPYTVAEAEIYKYGRERAYLENLLAWLDYQRRAVLYLIEHKTCDAYLFVFMQSDHAQHKFWRYLDPSFPGYNPQYDSQFKDAILQVYKALDRILGELMDNFDQDTTYILLSDHGAGPTYGIAYLNRWLRDQDLLQLRKRPATLAKYFLARSNLILKAYRLFAKAGLGKVAQLVSKPTRDKALNAFLSFEDIDWAHTKAYARGAFGQIFINLKGREPEGIVEPGGAYEELREQIIEKLRELKHPETGDPLVTDLHRREEAFHGPHLSQAPDILFSLQNYVYQSSVKMGLESPGILGASEYEDSGSHRPEGVVVLAGPHILQQDEFLHVNAEDLLPTVLALAGLPIPKNLDGSPISQAFDADFKSSLRFTDTDSESEWRRDKQNRTPELDEQELAQLEDRLRSLGYLG